MTRLLSSSCEASGGVLELVHCAAFLAGVAEVARSCVMRSGCRG
jgi:hypothetical protein